jgi:hypothetical protein
MGKYLSMIVALNDPTVLNQWRLIRRKTGIRFPAAARPVCTRRRRNTYLGPAIRHTAGALDCDRPSEARSSTVMLYYLAQCDTR